MTGRETLTMFARLRGVNEDQIKSVASNWIFIGTLYDTDFVSAKHLEEL
jgi:ABC-type multidrug transport system ATPase subunit